MFSNCTLLKNIMTTSWLQQFARSFLEIFDFKMKTVDCCPPPPMEPRFRMLTPSADGKQRQLLKMVPAVKLLQHFKYLVKSDPRSLYKDSLFFNCSLTSDNLKVLDFCFALATQNLRSAHRLAAAIRAELQRRGFRVTGLIVPKWRLCRNSFYLN